MRISIHIHRDHEWVVSGCQHSRQWGEIYSNGEGSNSAREDFERSQSQPWELESVSGRVQSRAEQQQESTSYGRASICTEGENRENIPSPPNPAEAQRNTNTNISHTTQEHQH